MRDDHPFVRWEAGVALASTAARLQARARLGLPVWVGRSDEMAFSELLTSMQRGLQASDPQLRVAMADALGLWNQQAVVELLILALEDPEAAVRASVAAALGTIGDKASVSALVTALEDTSLWVRRAAADALGAIGAPQAVAALQLALSDSHPLVRASVACALGHMSTAKARRALMDCVYDVDPAVRWQAARGLGMIGGVSSLPALQHLSEDGTGLLGRSIAEMADSATKAIEGRERGLWSWLRKTFQATQRRLRREP